MAYVHFTYKFHQDALHGAQIFYLKWLPRNGIASPSQIVEAVQEGI